VKLYSIRRILPHEDTRTSRGDVTRRLKYLHLNIHKKKSEAISITVQCVFNAVQSILQLSYIDKILDWDLEEI